MAYGSYGSKTTKKKTKSKGRKTKSTGRKR